MFALSAHRLTLMAHRSKSPLVTPSKSGIATSAVSVSGGPSRTTCTSFEQAAHIVRQSNSIPFLHHAIRPDEPCIFSLLLLRLPFRLCYGLVPLLNHFIPQGKFSLRFGKHGGLAVKRGLERGVFLCVLEVDGIKDGA